ncbi:MAG: FtsQ-type POTRA domain-containing protein [Candidatus Coatesbacteria bacterium]|nr:FtsQ-type POTRA domain-containing protein [Candidatus Coatesbacteria bacterium]
MKKRPIDLTNEYIAFCYRPTMGSPPVKRRHSRTWPKGIVSIVAVSTSAAALMVVMLFAPTRATVLKLVSSLFAVRQIVVETAGDLNTSSILIEACSRYLGRSLLNVSSQDVADSFDTEPSVRSVAFRKLFPSTLVVNVQERRPRFVTKLEGKWWALSDDGVILSLPDGRESVSLPSVFGLAFDYERPGGSVKNIVFADLVALCDSLSVLAPEDIGPDARIEVKDRIEVRVWPREGESALVLSLKGPKRQIEKYIQAKAEIASHKGEFRYVDLRFRGQVVLRKNS